MFSNKYVIFSDKIIAKANMKKYYCISPVMYSLLRADSIDLSDENLKLLIDNGIIDKSSQYNPFCVVSELNHVRLFIQITNTCNLVCKHCYANSGTQTGKEYFNYDTLKQLIDSAVSQGIVQFDFTGGEVFTQSYFIDILEYMNNLPLIYSIFTNLSLINNNIIEKLSQFAGLDTIITSLDYFNKLKHNNFRGSAYAYHKTIENILELKKRNINIKVNTMIMDDNHDDIIDIIAYFKKLDISVNLDVIFKVGRAVNLDNKLYDNLKFIKRVIPISKVSKHRCGVGHNLLFVDYNGIFNLCPSLTHDINSDFHMGYNINEAYKKLTYSSLP
jgi:MoaA/NifB/PqqE/SkfB family radical SAM enzyme